MADRWEFLRQAATEMQDRTEPSGRQRIGREIEALLAEVDSRHQHKWGEGFDRIVGAAHPETRLFQECEGCGKVRQVSR